MDGVQPKLDASFRARVARPWCHRWARIALLVRPTPIATPTAIAPQRMACTRVRTRMVAPALARTMRNNAGSPATVYHRRAPTQCRGGETRHHERSGSVPDRAREDVCTARHGSSVGIPDRRSDGTVRYGSILFYSNAHGSNEAHASRMPPVDHVGAYGTVRYKAR